MNENATAQRILDVAQELLQTRGYNAFSFRDLEEKVGIRTASIHYHYPTKCHLGVAIVRRYRAFVNESMAEAGRRETSALKRLRRYAAVLQDVLSDGGRMCVGGMLASDYATLPAEMQAEVAGFIADNERWLARVLREGSDSGELAFEGNAATGATALFSALEGAMFVARSSGDLDRYSRAADWLIRQLAAPRASARRR